MFTGIVEEVGRVTEARDVSGNLRLRIGAEHVSPGLGIGDSVAVSGCCLTVVATGDGAFEVELSRESVAKTAPRWHRGARVNLERAAALGSRLGGHIVSGHVDGVGEVLERRDAPGAYVLRVRGPERLSPHLVPKGSITVDGVSLTLVDVGGPAGSEPGWPAHEFSLWLIPHTLAVTTLGELEPGSKVNLESDVVAKYVERLHALEEATATDATKEEGDHA
ncbi:MAG: riboflavin synthase [Trueperaceae bacterium]